MTSKHRQSPPQVANDTGARIAEQERYRRVLAQRPGDPTAVPALVALLGDPSWRVRKTAVTMLDRFAGEPTVVPALIAGLASDDNAGLRNACSAALVRTGSSAVDGLVKALATQDPDHRRFIVEALGAIGGVEANAALFERLDDGDVNVRATAAEALGRIGDPDAIEGVRRRLAGSDGDLMEQVYLLEALARAGTRLPFDDLAPRLDNAALARPLYALLGSTGDARAAAPLVAGLQVPAEATRAAAAVAFGTLLALLPEGEANAAAGLLRRSPEAVSVLETLALHPDDRVAGAVVELFGALSDPALGPTILAACSCRALVDRAIHVVSRMGSAAVAPLLDAFERQDIESRVLFLEVLELVGDESIVPRLLEAAGGPEGRSAEAAVRVIGSLGGVAAVDPLMELARWVKPELANAAGLALATIAERHEAEVAAAVRQAYDGGDVRPAWLSALGGLGRDEDIDAIVVGTRHNAPDVRLAAVEAAAIYGDRFPCETLVFALADEQPEVRAAAARALGGIDSDEALDALLAAAHDVDAWVVAAAVSSLGATRDPRAVEVALAAAQSGSSPIAIAGLQSLFRLNPEGLAAAIERAMMHADPEVVREAVALSMRLPPEQAMTVLGVGLSHRAWSVRSAAAASLLSRGLRLPLEVIDTHLLNEAEPLVRESLERLSAVAGGAE